MEYIDFLKTKEIVTNGVVIADPREVESNE